MKSKSLIKDKYTIYYKLVHILKVVQTIYFNLHSMYVHLTRRSSVGNAFVYEYENHMFESFGTSKNTEIFLNGTENSKILQPGSCHR